MVISIKIVHSYDDDVILHMMFMISVNGRTCDNVITALCLRNSTH